jgi:hypothetical protein
MGRLRPVRRVTRVRVPGPMLEVPALRKVLLIHQIPVALRALLERLRVAGRLVVVSPTRG